MIPIIAGIAAAGPIANLFTEITHSISQPDPVKFEQSLQTSALNNSQQVQLDSILKGRKISQLSTEEQKSLAQFLVGKTVQISNTQGQAIQGIVSQSQSLNGASQLQIQGQVLDLNQISTLQVVG